MVRRLALCLILALLILSCMPTGEKPPSGTGRIFSESALKLVSLKFTDHFGLLTQSALFSSGFWVLLLPTVYTLRRAEELVAGGNETWYAHRSIATPLGPGKK